MCDRPGKLHLRPTAYCLQLAAGLVLNRRVKLQTPPMRGSQSTENENMALVRPLEEYEIDRDLLEFIQFFKGPLGVIPNSVRTMARKPHLARAFTALNIAVMECAGDVTPEFKRLIGYVTSQVSGCLYCQAHAILGSERFGAGEERLRDAWNFEKSPHFTDAEKAALRFAHAAASVPNAVTEEIGAELRKHWSDDDIVEIMGVVALFGYLNRWNDSMGSALEDLPIEAGEKYLEDSGWRVGKHKELGGKS